MITKGGKMEIFRPIKNKFDAKDWAEEFVRMVKIKPEIATDTGTMISWFANAIMAGWDKAMGEGQKHEPVGGKGLKELPVLPQKILKSEFFDKPLTEHERLENLKKKQDEIIDVINDEE